jgi:hypothetical protein
MIIGCGRSGNTMLRSMLIRGGEIVIPPESYVWPALMDEFYSMRWRPWDEFADWALDKFRQSDFGLTDEELAGIKSQARALKTRSLASVIDTVYRHFAHERRWGDKTPYNTLHLSKIERLFPKAQYIHIVRDPRAVTLSHVKASEVSPTIKKTTFEQSAERWCISVQNARRLARQVGPSRYFEVRYEDLVVEPEHRLQRVCAFARLTYSPAMLTFHEDAASLGDVARLEHHAKVRTPLDAARCDAWRHDMPRDAFAVVTELTAGLRSLFGY